MLPTKVSARSLYVHVPFCKHRCGYCDFPLVAGRDHLIDDYLRAVERESHRFNVASPLQTIFFGGGTPTQLSTTQLDRLFAIVAETAPRESGCEVTVEANPNDLSPEKLDCLLSHGVTRVSLGVQSFQGKKLIRLERTHEPAQAIDGIQRMLASGFNVSVDLIFGVSGESKASWIADLRTAIELDVQHVSTYHLTIEKGTAFWTRRLHGQSLDVDDSLGAEMYEIAIDALSAAGFEHYEVSNYCRPSHACQHNEVYWTGRPYLGLGPGAASFCAGVRWKNHASVAMYLRRLQADESPVDSKEKLEPEPAARERLVFGLRRLAGVDAGAFEIATGFSVERLGGEKLERWIADGLLVRDGQTLRLTRSGLMISDSLWPDLL